MHYLSLHAVLFDPGESLIPSHAGMSGVAFCDSYYIGLSSTPFRGSIAQLSLYGLHFPLSTLSAIRYLLTFKT